MSGKESSAESSLNHDANEAQVSAAASASENRAVVGPEVSPNHGAAGEQKKALEREPAAVDSEAPVDVAASGSGEKGEQGDGKTSAADETTVPDEADIKYPSGAKLAFLTFGLCMATFVIALDNTIIATAIPKITTDFNSLNDVGWYGSAYLLTTTSLQPSFGKVYANFNVKWTYLISLIIFEVGSIICAASPNSVVLIIGRAVAGIGSAALFSGGINIVGYTVPLKKRPIYISILSSMFGISSVVGPLMGGAFTDKLTWRWCFWINLPVGGIALATVFFFFHNTERAVNKLTFKQRLQEIDLLGALLLICSIVCLLLALQWGGSVYAWNSAKVLGLIIGAALIALVFIAYQIRIGDRATIPPRVFLQRSVFSSSLFSAFLSAGLYTHIYFLPFYFQAVKGTTAEGSGIRSIPYLVSNTIASIIVGAFITAKGLYTPFMWVGTVIFTVGAGMLYTLSVDSDAGMWIGYQLIAGFGSGACIQIPFIAVQSVLNAKDIPSGNAIAIFFNTLGGAISISIAQSVFSNTLVSQISQRTTGLDAASIIASGATQVANVTPPDQLQGVLESYTLAVDKTFILPIAVGGAAFICSLFVEIKRIDGKKLLTGGV
ncbi:MAG: hypothetical protein M1829_005815 [Trizodia sp. TS-e1964]|nr:MAG: hypothetical protein M1829_005815 [Trizodia sp. TS-e1964]